MAPADLEAALASVAMKMAATVKKTVTIRGAETQMITKAEIRMKRMLVVVMTQK